MKKSYWKTDLRADKTTVCPVCSRVNNHKLGDCCEHCVKLVQKTTVGIPQVWYYKNFDPKFA